MPIHASSSATKRRPYPVLSPARRSLQKRDVARPSEHRLQPILGRICAERREAEHGDPAPRCVECGRRIAERAGTVRDVSLEMRVQRGGRTETLDLPLGVCRVGVRGGEVAYEPDHLEVGRDQLGDAPAAHAGVELHVHAHAGRHIVGGDDELDVRVARLAYLAVERGPHDDDPRRRELTAKHERLWHGRDTHRRCACTERCSRDVGRAVAIRIRLHDSPDLRAAQRLEQHAHIPPHAPRSMVISERYISAGREGGRRSGRSRRARHVVPLRPMRAAVPQRPQRRPVGRPSPWRGTRRRCR